MADELGNFHSCKYCSDLTIDLPWSDRRWDELFKERGVDNAPQRRSFTSGHLALLSKTFVVGEGGDETAEEIDGEYYLSVVKTGCRFWSLMPGLERELNRFVIKDMFLAVFAEPRLTSEGYSLPICWVILDYHGCYSFSSGGLTQMNLFQTEDKHGPALIANHVDKSAVGDLGARRLRRRRAFAKPRSHETFDLARSWLWGCEQQLGPRSCRSANITFTPKRLLKLRKEGHSSWTIQLHITTKSETLRYATLSYCWGGAQSLKAELLNVQAWQEAVPFGFLPATIQDAIETAWEIGLEYLWVDALCIVQDDKVDVEEQIALMPQIYSASIVTIAASRSNSVTEGFLQDRTLHANNTFFKLGYTGEDGETGSVFLREVRFEQSWSEYRGNLDLRYQEPLFLRAWALQERILSTRVIDFRSYQTRWDCLHVKGDNQVQYRDGDTAGLGPQVDPRLQKIFKPSGILSGGSRTESSFQEKSIMQSWHETLELYSRLNLTYNKDRGVAISGIAERYGALINDTYTAGLWERSLPSELLWSTGSRDWWKYTTREFNARLPKPTEYQGPSWSWTANNSDIDHVSCYLAPNERCTVEVRSIDIRLANEKAPFGDVKTASLCLRGKLRRANLKTQGDFVPFKTKDEPDVLQSVTTTAFDTDNTAEVIHVCYARHLRMDFLEDSEAGSVRCADMPVYLLEVSAIELMGLVLRELPDGTFVRCGLYDFGEEEELDPILPYWPRRWSAFSVDDWRLWERVAQTRDIVLV